MSLTMLTIVPQLFRPSSPRRSVWLKLCVAELLCSADLWSSGVKGCGGLKRDDMGLCRVSLGSCVILGCDLKFSKTRPSRLL